MPYSIRKVSGKDCYSVRKTGKRVKGSRITAKCTSLEKAKKQMRLLYALERPGFVPKSRKNITVKRMQKK
jgi:hypothetical protein